MTLLIRAAIFCLAVFVLPNIAGAQQHPVKITFVTPEGWRGETITVPPGFAPNMSLKGVEKIRFAPGMFSVKKESYLFGFARFETKAEDFFSYALVFWLPDTKPLDQKLMHAELLKYYQGLAAAVGKGKKLNIDTKAFKLDVQPIEKKKGEYTATLQWVEPFVTGKPQSLRFELKTAKLPDMNASYLSMAVSPQPADHAIWKSLRKVIASVTYEATGKPSANQAPTENP